jgi:prepilin peptidase CpaA
VLIRSLGGGDWKLVGGLGAFFGPQRLVQVLLLTVVLNGLMALIFIVWRRRVRQTLGNLLRMAGAMSRFHLPDDDLTIDNPQAAKVPFGVAAAIAVLLYAARNQPWPRF